MRKFNYFSLPLNRNGAWAQNQLVIYLKDHEVHNAYENMLFPAYNVVLGHNLHPSTL